MLEAISWKDFLIGYAGASLLHAAAVTALYFRRDTKNLVSKIVNRAQGPATKQGGSLPEEILAALGRIIQIARVKQFPREELLLALQLELKQHAAGVWNKPTLQERINAFILTETVIQCQISWTEFEIRQLWQ